LIAGQKNPYPIALHRKGKEASLKPQSEQTHVRHRDDGCLERARSREGGPAIRSAFRAVIWIVLGDVSEQRVARLLCRSEIIHLVGLRRSLVSFKHGSWLNIAEIELTVLSNICLSQWIPDEATLRRQVEANARAQRECPARQLAFHHPRRPAKMLACYPRASN
jgi:hypothetical protein